MIEARTSFTRNNVLKLWKYLIEDLKMLGVKKLYGKFASGNINHISIRILQTTLLKVLKEIMISYLTMHLSAKKYLSLFVLDMLHPRNPSVYRSEISRSV